MLTVASGSAVIQENEYNHEGIRIARTEDGIERKYLYDNGSVAYTLDGSSVSSANVLGGYQNVIGTYRASDYYVYNKDAQGSTESITNRSFNAKAAYEYSDFGEVTELLETIDNEICYTGAIHDETTGLYYMNARYYDPANGRFISQDSYRGEIDDYGQWHLYVYCANNPINYTDPSGHDLVMTAIAATSVLLLSASYMSTEQFLDSWNDFCTVVGNGLSSIATQLKNGLVDAYNWGKAYIKKVTKDVRAFSTVVKAQGKINDKVKNKKKGPKYFEGFLKNSGGYSYVAIGKSLTSTKARNRVANQLNVFAVSKSYALRLAKNFSGVVGPEIDKGKEGVLGYYYHYHVKKRKNKAHIWFAS